AKLAFIDTQNSAEHGSAADDLAALHGRDRARVRALAIVEVALASRVHVRDVGVVHDDRVRDVHVADVARRVPIPRNVDLARTEREPADTAAEGDGDADVRAPDPTAERGGINEPVVPRPGNPAPSLAHVRPSAVVKRRETQGGVMDPRPPPGRNPDPASVAIRYPGVRYVARTPDVAVLGFVMPVAVGIEIFVTHDIARNVLGRLRLALAP